VDTVGHEVAAPLLVRVRKARESANRQPFVLDVSLEIPACITILLGPSGAGKSTLLDCIAGLVRPDSGRVSVGQELWFDSSQRIGVPVHQRRVGYVFQSLTLFPHLNVEENIGYGIAHLPPRERKARIDEILSAFRVAALRQRKPAEISGGEAQRVELARSLVTDPQVLLLDEPMTGLDEQLKAHIIEDLRAWRTARNIPILYVTHSKMEAQALGDHLVMMRSGSIVPEQKIAHQRTQLEQ
jgi:molybdate transport system ATP-binding protein